METSERRPAGFDVEGVLRWVLGHVDVQDEGGEHWDPTLNLRELVGHKIRIRVEDLDDVRGGET
jgi:hypothetical protein